MYGFQESTQTWIKKNRRFFYWCGTIISSSNRKGDVPTLDRLWGGIGLWYPVDKSFLSISRCSLLLISFHFAKLKDDLVVRWSHKKGQKKLVFSSVLRLSFLFSFFLLAFLTITFHLFCKSLQTLKFIELAYLTNLCLKACEK